MMEIINDIEFLKSFWPISSFNEAYGNTSGILGYRATILTDSLGDPDKTAVIVFRSFIQETDHIRQKYIIGIRFYSYGDIATIDLLSFDLQYHRDIAFQHAKNLSWWQINDLKIYSMPDVFNANFLIPFAFAGGYVGHNKEGELYFGGMSTDYGNILFGVSTNDLALYVASLCGIKAVPDSQERGKGFAEKLLQFMKEHKKKRDFYELWVGKICDWSIQRQFSIQPQHLSALMTMKVSDRVIEENGNPIEITVDEMTGKFSNSCLMASLAAKLRNK